MLCSLPRRTGTGACWFLPCPHGLPRSLGGSASTSLLSRPAQASHALRDWDRGKPRGSSPPTPPDMRVRIRRFGGLSNRFHSQSRNPERVEVSIGQCETERG